MDERHFQQQFLRLGIRLRREDEDHSAVGSGGRLSKDAGNQQQPAGENIPSERRPGIDFKGFLERCASDCTPSFFPLTFSELCV